MIPYSTLVELSNARHTQLLREAADHRLAVEARRSRRRVRRWFPASLRVGRPVPDGGAAA